MRRPHLIGLAVFCAGAIACGAEPTTGIHPSAAVRAAGATVVNVSNDTTAQNETPLAVNPRNASNVVTGGNDWNYNDGCSVNASFDGGKSWTATLPNGFLPGVTRFTNDPAVAGTGRYDYGGDPAIGFGPDGTAYYACFGYQAASPYGVALLVSRSSDGGRTWLKGGAAEPLTQVSSWNGDGKSRGSTGQFPDHEAIHVASDGTIYLTWAQFNGLGSHSPVYLAASRDGGRTFSTPVKVTSGSVRSDQDQRVVTNPSGSVAYLTFDNSIQGGKGTALYVSRSTDHGLTWGAPIRLGTFNDPVDLFPPFFNIDGAPFRGPGSYPAPAYDPARDRLYVAYADKDASGRAQVYLTWAAASDLAHWSTPTVVAPNPAGDRFGAELSIAPSGRIDVMFDDRSYSNNALVDVTYASSTDGGVTWTSRRVTRTGFDPAQFGVPSGSGIRPFLGDYNGIVSLAEGAAFTWTGPGTTYGALPTNLEIYFASVTP